MKGKAAGPTAVVVDMMEAAGEFWSKVDNFIVLNDVEDIPRMTCRTV